MKKMRTRKRAKYSRSYERKRDIVVLVDAMDAMKRQCLSQTVQYFPTTCQTNHMRDPIMGSRIVHGTDGTGSVSVCSA